MADTYRHPKPVRAIKGVNREARGDVVPFLHHPSPQPWPHCDRPCGQCHKDPCSCGHRGSDDPDPDCSIAPCPMGQSMVCLPNEDDGAEYTIGIKKNRSRLDARLTAILTFCIRVVAFLFLLLTLITCIVYYNKYIRKISYDSGYEDGIADGEQRTAARYFPYTMTPEGGPCTVWDDGLCEEAENAQAAIRFARYYLNMGDAQSALRDWEQALRYYRQSILLGSSNGAKAAILAAKRIQFQLMTCEYDEASLARISHGFDSHPLGALIEMRQKQTALKALGYYIAPIDNSYNAAMRAAIRDFQGDLWFDQTGVLTAEQTTLLVCGAAQIAKDSASENILGIMYAGGLGVRQSTDFAMSWFDRAAIRGNGDAAWNLALMYGTGTVRSSVLVCDAVQNAERADSYLAEASAMGHPAARHAIRKYPSDTSEIRWRKLRGDLSSPEILDRVGRGCNPNP